jgi:ribonuclease BN (tRNA processing enzyme)
VLVHEVLDVGPMRERIMRLPNGEQVLNHLASSHSSAEQVAAHAKAAGARQVVLSHLVPGDFEYSDDEWESRVRASYDGEVLCGVDLDELALAR